MVQLMIQRLDFVYFIVVQYSKGGGNFKGRNQIALLVILKTNPKREIHFREYCKSRA